ncbi:9392_t:CDS:2 [Entrophospora sp. SA101]|nr:9392_t:CDS:2 [Entrophospora sp. SA101]
MNTNNADGTSFPSLPEFSSDNNKNARSKSEELTIKDLSNDITDVLIFPKSSTDEGQKKIRSQSRYFIQDTLELKQPIIGLLKDFTLPVSQELNLEGGVMLPELDLEALLAEFN